MRRYSYRAFGLGILSDLQMPELPPAPGALPSVDLSIEMVGGIEGMPPEASEGFCRYEGGGYVLRAPKIADFHVESGRRIRMAVAPAADSRMAKLYLLGSALGMALHQRGLLVMHASAVLRGGAVCMFVGDSGAGKSTLAAGLAAAGFGVLGDDVVAVRVNGDGASEVWPGARSFKVWGDALDALGLEDVKRTRVADRADKFFVVNQSPVADAGYPVSELILLDTAAEAVSLEPLSNLEAVRAISSNTYRPEYVALLGRTAEHFQQCAALASSISARRFRRPWNLGRVRGDIEFLRASQ
jgi:hypothetical protein